MLKWIIGAVAVMTLTLWFSGVRAQQAAFYGPNGQYLGQVVVLSPTQPIPPAWGTNGQ